MILSAGLTPAWQQILVFDKLQLDQVNRARQAVWAPSGKVLNVGVALAFLQEESLTLTAGGGWARQAMEAELATLGVRQRWVNSDVNSRVCTTVLDMSAGTTTELVENSRDFSEGNLAEFQHAYLVEVPAADVVVLSGSLPGGTPATYYRDLVRQTPGRVLMDARGPELLNALTERPFLVKPNREELTTTLRRDLTRTEDLVQGMLELNSLGARWVVITDGGKSVWVSSAGQTWELSPPRVDVVNPIGCGDSLAAGVATALVRGTDVIEAVRYGMACAAWNATQLLPCRLDPGAIHELVREVTIR